VRVGREAIVPRELDAALEELFGAPVRHVRIFEHSWFARLHGRAIATTRRGRIYLRGSAADFWSNPELVLHEYWHVIGQWQTRSLTTPRYLAECLRCGYWNNRFEIEARAFAAANAARLRERLRRLRPASGRLE
jgi:hypothetical protein